MAVGSKVNCAYTTSNNTSISGQPQPRPQTETPHRPPHLTPGNMSTTGAAVRTGGNARTAVFLQDACYLHRYIRSPDLSAIVERPERLRAVKLGISAAIARLEETSSKLGIPAGSTGDELVAALEKLDLLTEAKVEVVDVVNSSAALSLLQHPAVKFVHGDIEGDVYLEKLVALSKNSLEKISNSESEIPADLSQGDLYCTYHIHQDHLTED